MRERPGLARNRTQSAASVAAMAVALALPIALLCVVPSGTHDRSTDPTASAVAGDLLVDRASLGARLDVPWQVPGEPAIYATAPTHASVVAADRAIRRAMGTTALRVEVHAVNVGDESVSVAVVDPADAPKALTPWAASQLQQGRALFSTVPDAGRLRRLAPSVPAAPFGRGRAVSFLTGSLWALMSPAQLDQLPGRHPVESVMYLRTGPASVAEKARLRSISHPVRPVPPTLKQVRAALEGATPAAVPRAPHDPPGVWIVSDSGPRMDLRTAAILGLTGFATLLALLVLTITLTLRGVDGSDDQRIALAVGAPPERLRRLRALEGMALTALAAILALPLGWLPAAAVRAGWHSNGGWTRQVGDRVGPGLLAVPVLVLPVLLAGVLWTAVPALRAALFGRRATDQVTPRY